MRLVRTILALAIAASLALLPVGASAAGLGMMVDAAQSGLQMGTSAEMSMDCCQDDMNGAPSDAGRHNCSMGFCCAGGFVALGDVRSVVFRFGPAAESKVAIPADQFVPVRGASPPFRPPRV
jgi:hypothetical protein